jgi:hypothetical protein
VNRAGAAGIAAIVAAGAWAYVLYARRPDRPHHTRLPAPPASHRALAAKPGQFSIAGDVRDDRGARIADADIIVDGETLARTDGDGAWSLALPAGAHRIYARAANVLAVGEARGGDDAQLIPALAVTGNLDGIELSVVRAATITGTVASADRKPMRGVLVHARSPDGRAVRAPVIASDTAITDASGRFELHVAPDTYVLDAGDVTTPALDAPGAIEIVEPSGCTIAGRVVDSDGKPTNDGAIEVGEAGEFRRAGALRGDGTFTVTTTEAGVTLRAWPWRSPPSPARTFECAPGKHVDATLVVPTAAPLAIAGAVVDDHGARVPLAAIDITPLDPVDDPGIEQQERASSDGTYRVYAEPPGTYRVTTSAVGHGFASAIASAPGTRTLVLGGTGRIAGTVTGVADGSIAIDFETCNVAPSPVAIAADPRIVPVVGGRFELDGVPACKLSLLAHWRAQTTRVDVDVRPGQMSLVEIALGDRDIAKLVHGVVLDRDREPVAGADVTATVGERVVASATTDEHGAFELHAPSGAVIASRGATAIVGFANVGDELAVLQAQ